MSGFSVGALVFGGVLFSILVLVLTVTVIMPIIWHLMERADEFWTKVFRR